MSMDPQSRIEALNIQAVEELRRVLDRVEGKLDKHIEEGAEVKTAIAILTRNEIEPSRVAALETRIESLTWMMRAAMGAASVALVSIIAELILLAVR